MLLGIFDYLRVQQIDAIGYLIFIIPLSFAIFNILIIKPRHIGRLKRIYHPFLYINKNSKFHAVIFVIYIIFIIIGFIRAVLYGARESYVGTAEIMLVVCIVTFFYMFIVDAIEKKYFDSVPYYIGVSLLILMLINIIGVSMGIDNPGIESNYSRAFINPFGITAFRLNYPFMTSGQMLSIEAGLLVIFGIYSENVRHNFWNFLLRILMVVAGLAVMMGHGGRASIVFLAAVILFVTIWKIARPFLATALVLIFLFPVIVAFTDIGGAVQTIMDATGINLSRHAGDVATFSNRDQIYLSVINGVIYQSNILSQLFGYGAYGQVTSGISYDYSMLFETSYSNPYKMPTHNTVLQNMVDYGFVGLVTYIILVFSLVSLIRKNKRIKNNIRVGHKNEKLLTALVLYLMAMSMTEVSVTYYSIGILSIFILINLFAIFEYANIRLNFALPLHAETRENSSE